MRNSDAADLVALLQRSALAMRGDVLAKRWTRAALRAAVRSGAVTRMLPERYAATEHAQSVFTRAHAATTWVGSSSVLVGTGAASAWGLCDPPAAAIRVSAPYGTHRRCPPWVHLSRTLNVLPAAEWNACRVATPAWAAVTAFAQTPSSARDRLIYRVVQQGLATPAELAEAADSLPRLQGRRHLATIIAATAEGAESHLETIGLRTVFASKEFSRFIRQHRLCVDGTSWRLDMFDPMTRTVVELDGAETHGRAAQRARDLRRDASLSASGVLTLRFTYADLVERAPWCRDVVRRTLAVRSTPAEWA